MKSSRVSEENLRFLAFFRRPKSYKIPLCVHTLWKSSHVDEDFFRFFRGQRALKSPSVYSVKVISESLFSLTFLHICHFPDFPDQYFLPRLFPDLPDFLPVHLYNCIFVPFLKRAAGEDFFYQFTFITVFLRLFWSTPQAKMFYQFPYITVFLRIFWNAPQAKIFYQFTSRFFTNSIL